MISFFQVSNYVRAASLLGIVLGLFYSNFEIFAQQDRYDPELNRRTYVPDVAKHSANTLDSITAADYARRNKIKSNMADFKPANWHINIIYGASYLGEFKDTKNFYKDEGYKYLVVDLKDPDEKERIPKLVQIILQKNVTPRWQLEVGVSFVINQRISGSNWLKFDDDGAPPNLFFDITQKSKLTLLQIGGRYFLMPVNPTSRLELSTGTSVAFYNYYMTSTNFYAQNIGNLSALNLINQTSSSFTYDKKALGVVGDLSIDFYISPKVSWQFRYEKRISQKIKLSGESYEYVVSKQVAPHQYTHVTYLKRLPSRDIDLSGYTLTMGFHIHLF